MHSLQCVSIAFCGCSVNMYLNVQLGHCERSEVGDGVSTTSCTFLSSATNLTNKLPPSAN